MPVDVLTKDAPQFVDGEFRPGDIIEVLNRLEFKNGFSVLKLDRPCRDYFIDAIKARHGANK